MLTISKSPNQNFLSIGYMDSTSLMLQCPMVLESMQGDRGRSTNFGERQNNKIILEFSNFSKGSAPVLPAPLAILVIQMPSNT